MKTSVYSLYKSEKFRGKISTYLKLSVYLWFFQYSYFINMQCMWYPQKTPKIWLRLAVYVIQSLSCVRHSRLLCLPLSPRVYSDSHPWSWWCYPIISFSDTPFSFFLQPFPASESFPMSWLFASHGQSIEASALASDLPRNI